MQKFSIILLLALLPFAAFGSMEWKKTLIEYVAQPDDEEVTAAFYFANTGSEPIEIMDTKSSCGCTVVKMDKRVFAPGEVGTIRVKFTFGERTGLQKKNIRVYTDDPDNPMTDLKLVVDIPIVMTIEPQLLFWSKDEASTPKTSIVSFDTEEPVDITNITVPQEDFVAELGVVEDGWVYSLTIVPLKTDKPQNSILEFTTTLGSEEKPKTGKIALRVY